MPAIQKQRITNFSSTIVWFPRLSSMIIFSSSAMRTGGCSKMAEKTTTSVSCWMYFVSHFHDKMLSWSEWRQVHCLLFQDKLRLERPDDDPSEDKQHKLKKGTESVTWISPVQIIFRRPSTNWLQFHKGTHLQMVINVGNSCEPIFKSFSLSWSHQHV